MKEVEFSYVNDKYAKMFAKTVCEMTCVDVSVASEIDRKLYEIINRWDKLLLKQWNKAYFEDNLRDVYLIRDDSVIDYIAMDLELATEFTNYVNCILEYAISVDKIRYEFMRILTEWENSLFHEWKVRTLEEASADGLQCKE